MTMDLIYSFMRRALFCLEPEKAHRLAVKSLSLMPQMGSAANLAAKIPAHAMLAQQLWSLDFPHPIGLAAGFDKSAECYRGALGLGFGFVEIGSVTPRPQSGNPRPRLFRLPADAAVINRMGFNNDGMEAVALRLAGRQGALGVVGVNLGKNKETIDAAADYELGITRLGPYADYLVINVSSPNTPGLRALQGKEQLAELIQRCCIARDQLDTRPPLLLKIAPDLAIEDESDIAETALAYGLNGLIVSNTTIARPALQEIEMAKEQGGLSGAPLFSSSTALLARMYQLTEGKLPIIGVGGVASASDAYRKIRAGASLVQLYSAMIFDGPGLALRIAKELPVLLQADGFRHVSDAVGADHR